MHHSRVKEHGYVRLLLGSVIFHQARDTPIIFKIYLKHKIWLVKIWRNYGHSPNLPTFPPTKVFLHMVGIIWQFLGFRVFIQDVFEWSKLSVPRQIIVLAIMPLPTCNQPQEIFQYIASYITNSLNMVCNTVPRTNMT